MDFRLAAGISGLSRLKLEWLPFALLERAPAGAAFGPYARTDYDDLGHGASLLLALKLSANKPPRWEALWPYYYRGAEWRRTRENRWTSDTFARRSEKR